MATSTVFASSVHGRVDILHLVDLISMHNECLDAVGTFFNAVSK